MMYGRTIYADQKLIINQQEISGVTDFNGDFDIPYENVDLLGGNFAAEIQGELSRNISFSRFLIQSDSLKYLTGSAFCSGFVNYKNYSFGFESGYLTNYNVTCAVGDIASITTDFIVYGNIGGGLNHQILPSQNISDIYVANYGNIFISANQGQTNRITSFDYNISCERIPIFTLGSFNPTEVYLKKPLIIDLNLTIEIDDYEAEDIQTLLCSPEIQNITIDLKNCKNTEIIESFYAPNARLISNSYNSDIDNPANIELTFRSFLM
jgi:hypothetical protein